MIDSTTNIFAYCVIPLITFLLIFLAYKLLSKLTGFRDNKPKDCGAESYLEKQSTSSDYDFVYPFADDAPTDNIKSVHVDSAGYVHVEWR